MKQLFMLCLLILLSQSTIQALDNHRVGFKMGLTSIDNEDGWSFEKGSFFTDFTYDMPTLVKPRIDLGYINIDEEDKGGVSSLLQLAINGIYDVDLSAYTTQVKPYVLGGLGYEKVFDATPVFESHPFIQAGLGAKYQLTDRVTLVSEFRALQMFGGDDEDNEFALMIGIDVPLFVEVIRAPIQKQTKALPEVPAPISPVVEQTVVQYQEPVVVSNTVSIDDDHDGIANTIDKCPHTAEGSAVDTHGCTIINAIVIPQEVTYVEDGQETVTQPKEIEIKTPSTQRTTYTAPAKLKRQNLKVRFESSSATIKSVSKANIKQFAKHLKNNPNLSVTIEGYTDNSGSRAKNLELSKKRAEAVKKLLIQYGATASMIKAIGKGDLNPIADNETEIGRKQNRRIEAVIK